MGHNLLVVLIFWQELLCWYFVGLVVVVLVSASVVDGVVVSRVAVVSAVARTLSIVSFRVSSLVVVDNILTFYSQL